MDMMNIPFVVAHLSTSQTAPPTSPTFFSPAKSQPFRLPANQPIIALKDSGTLLLGGYMVGGISPIYFPQFGKDLLGLTAGKKCVDG